MKSDRHKINLMILELLQPVVYLTSCCALQLCTWLERICIIDGRRNCREQKGANNLLPLDALARVSPI